MYILQIKLLKEFLLLDGFIDLMGRGELIKSMLQVYFLAVQKQLFVESLNENITHKYIFKILVFIFIFKLNAQNGNFTSGQRKEDAGSNF